MTFGLSSSVEELLQLRIHNTVVIVVEILWLIHNCFSSLISWLSFSSFPAILLLISCLTWPSSSWALSTISSFCLSSLQMEHPPPSNWSRRSLIWSSRFPVSSDHLQLPHNLLISSFNTIDFRVVIASLNPACLMISHHVLSFGLQLIQEFVKDSSFLLSDESSRMGSLMLHVEILLICINMMLGFLGGSNLKIERVDCLFSLTSSKSMFGSVILKFFNPRKSVRLKFSFPKLDFRQCFMQSYQSVVPHFSFLIKSHLPVFIIRWKLLELNKMIGLITGFNKKQSKHSWYQLYSC